MIKIVCWSDHLPDEWSDGQHAKTFRILSLPLPHQERAIHRTICKQSDTARVFMRLNEESGIKRMSRPRFWRKRDWEFSCSSSYLRSPCAPLCFPAYCEVCTLRTPNKEERAVDSMQIVSCKSHQQLRIWRRNQHRMIVFSSFIASNRIVIFDLRSHRICAVFVRETVCPFVSNWSMPHIIINFQPGAQWWEDFSSEDRDGRK